MQPDGALGHHLTMRLLDDRPIASDAASRRRAARAIYRVGTGLGLLAFAIADTHMHVVAVANRLEAGELARRIEISLHRQLRPGARFQPMRSRPIVDQWHLYRAVMYVLRQLEHHAPQLDPLHEGTSLPELIGMRVLDRTTPDLVRLLLPRLELSDFEAQLGIATADAGSAAPTDVDVLGDAVAGAFGLTNGVVSARARRAAAHAATDVTAAALARILDAHPSSIARARAASADAVAVRAVRRQLAARLELARRSSEGVTRTPLLGSASEDT
jgi:hypothetical protein